MLAACYAPKIEQGASCDPDTNLCPFPQTCQQSGGEYVCTSTTPVDAEPADAAPRDAPPDAAAIPDAALPTIAAVQAIASSSVAATASLTFPDAIAHHDAIIVCATFPSGTVTPQGVSDSLGNTYALAVGPVVANGYDHYIAIAANSAAGDDTVTVTLSAAATGGWEVLALEYTGLALDTPFDTSAYDSGNGTAMTSGSVSTSSPHELLLGYGHAGEPVAGPGYTSRDTGPASLVEDRVVFATGDYTATATTSSGVWTLILATFAGR